MIGDDGASAVEYALIVAAVAALLVPILFALTDLLGKVLVDSCKSTARQNGISSSQIAADQADCD